MKKLFSLMAAAVLVYSLSGCRGPGSGGEKPWIIVTDPDTMPFAYTDSKGRLVGIDVELLNAIAKDQGFRYELRSLDGEGAEKACRSGQADGMIAGISITEERRENGWIFSDSYCHVTQSAAVRGDSPITKMEDLEKRNVAVKTGSAGAIWADSLIHEIGFNIAYCADSSSMVQAVLDGLADACFTDTLYLSSLIRESGLNLRILKNSENSGSEYALAVFSEDSRELIERFNQGLAHIRENGTYDEILRKYPDSN